MAFKPIPVPGRNVATAEMRYSIREERGKPRLVIKIAQRLLSQVNPNAKFWRIDTDAESGRGRLTGLVQTDNNPATRKGTAHSSNAMQFTWHASDEVCRWFPAKDGGVYPLNNHKITSMGIEFDLPK
jgi:hypothetical protein